MRFHEVPWVSIRFHEVLWDFMRFYNVPVNQSVPTEANRDLASYIRKWVVVLDEPPNCRESKALGIKASKLVGNHLRNPDLAVLKGTVQDALLGDNHRLARCLVTMDALLLLQVVQR
jgi:hypothetical protein